jgi:hypothetical protein
MSHPGMVEARSGKPWPYIQKFPLNRNLEKFNDNVDRKEPGLAPDSCLLRMKSLSKCGNRQPDFTWIGSDDTYMLSGVALALFSMEAMDLGTISSIGYAQNIFHALQFSRIQLNYDMIVKKETLISADELISICIGLLNYHRMCVKYNFTMERAEVEKFTSLIAASLGRHGYWVLPDFSSLNDVTRFTSAMVSKKNWWAHQCALLYAYPLQLIFKEITGTKTCIAWDSTEYDL